MPAPRLGYLRRAPASMALLVVLAPAAAFAAPVSDSPAQAPAGEYVLDPRDASLVLKLPTFLGLPAPTLRLTRLEGRFRLDPESRDVKDATITADPRSVEASGPKARVAASEFEPDRFPNITFTATAFQREEAGQGKLVGNLTFHGVTRPLTLDVVMRDFAPDTATSQARFRFTGQGRVSRSDFGLTQGRPFIGDTVNLVFDMEFVKQPRGEARR